jgi:hypothetical protein
MQMVSNGTLRPLVKGHDETKDMSMRLLSVQYLRRFMERIYIQRFGRYFYRVFPLKCSWKAADPIAEDTGFSLSGQITMTWIPQNPL